MASPFSLFRRHQKVLMVVLTGLAMFAFIVMDALSRMEDSSAFIPLVTASVGAAAFWFFGQQSQKGSGFTLLGAAFGAACGFIIIRTGPAPEGITTSLGTISGQQVQTMQKERSLANQFISGAVQERTVMGQNLEQFFFGGTTPAEMVERFLLLDKASRLNVSIGDDQIRQYLLDASSNELDTKKFNDIRRRLQIGKGALFRILRDELSVRVVRIMLMPRPIELPQQKWENFKKYEVAYSIDAVEVPIKPFEADVTEPQIGELKAIFDKYKNEADRGNRQFYQPERQRLAWLRFNRPEIEEQIPAPTEDELKAQYEKDKASFYPAIPEDTTEPDDLNLNLDGFPGGLPGASKPGPSGTPPAPQTIPPLDTPTDKPPADGDPPEDSSPSNAPESDGDKESASESPSGTDADSGDSSCDPQASDQTEANASGDAPPEKPAAEKPAAEKPATEKPAPPPLTLPDIPDLDVEEEPASTVTTDGEQAYQSFESVRERVLESVRQNQARERMKSLEDQAISVISRARRDAARKKKSEKQLVAAVTTAAKQFASQTPGAYYFEQSSALSYVEMVAQPETDKTATETEPATDTEPAESDAETETQEPDAKPETDGVTPDESETDPAKAAPKLPEPTDSGDDNGCQEEPPTPDTKVPAVQNTAPNLPADVTLPPQEKPQSPQGEDPAQPADSASAPDTSEGKETGSPESEVVEADPAADAVDPAAPIENEIALAQGKFNFQQRRAPTVAETVFGGSTGLLFPETAGGSFTNGTQDFQYLYWSIEKIDGRVPETLEEVIDEVKQAYATREARSAADKRARIIAEHIRKEESTVPEALKAWPAGDTTNIGSRTVTGNADSDALQVISPSDFSTLTQADGLSPNPFEPPQPGQIDGIEGANYEFLKTVAGMETGDIQVIPNADQTSFYVVFLKGRSPDGTSGPLYEGAQEEFLREQQFMHDQREELQELNYRIRLKYFGLQQMAFQSIQSRWMQGLMQEYDVDTQAIGAL